MDLAYMLNHKDTHNEFWRVTLNVNLNVEKRKKKIPHGTFNVYNYIFFSLTN